ncbi:MAG: HlyD family efflux transporter periplasmic adaptor subunit [Pirellulaceae bacterium]
MPESIQSDEHVESLFAKVERLCKSPTAFSPAWDAILSVLIDHRIVQSAAAWAIQSEQPELLAKSSDWPVGPLDLAFARTSDRRSCIVDHASASTEIVICAEHSDDMDVDTLEHQRAVLRGVAELLGIAWVRHRFDSLAGRDDAQALPSRFVELLTSDLDTDETLSELSRLLLTSSGADRVSLLQWRWGKIGLLCIAPAGAVNQRSPLITSLKALARNTFRQERGVAFCQGETSISPIEPALCDYIDQSYARQIIVEKNVDEGTGHGVAVVIERFEASPKELPKETALATQTLPVLSAIVRRRDHGLRGLWHRIGPTSAKPLRLVWIALIACLLFAAIFVQTDFRLPVEGHLHPEAFRSVFATSEGFVDQIHVGHEERVSAGDMLLTLRDPRLELEQSELEGRMAALQSQIASAQVARSTRSRNNDRSDDTRLSANEQDLVIQLAGLQREHEVLVQHLQRLVIVSPIDGIVHRWDLEQALPERPVKHGQHLLDVIDPQSSWELRLDIPDDVVSYVIDAQRHDSRPVAFRVRSHPEATHYAQLKRISNATQFDARGRNVVLATAEIHDDDVSDRRVGAGVVAQIDCGRRSIAFVWLRELIEVWRRSFLI